MQAERRGRGRGRRGYDDYVFKILTTYHCVSIMCTWFQIQSKYQDQRMKQWKYLIRISPREPELTPSVNSSAFASCKEETWLQKKLHTNRHRSRIFRKSTLLGAQVLLQTMNVKCGRDIRQVQYTYKEHTWNSSWALHLLVSRSISYCIFPFVFYFNTDHLHYCRKTWCNFL